MTDPVATGARAAAQRLTPEYGPRLALDVEAALRARRLPQPPQYDLDPVSLGSLVVSVATLVWTIYADLRKGDTPDPAPDKVAHTVRIELRDLGEAGPIAHPLLVDVTITETIEAIEDSG